MPDSLATEWIARGDRAFEKQSRAHQLNQVLAEIYYPERASFFSEIVGDEYYRGIYDGYPILMRWRLGNALGAMTRGRGQEWFNSQTFPFHLNEVDEVGAWNEDTTRTLRAIIYDARAQFGGAKSLGDQDYAVFGNACTKVTTNSDNTGLLYVNKHLAKVAAEENVEGQIDITHEDLSPTGRQFGAMFGEKGSIPKKLKSIAGKDPNGIIEGIRLAVFPVEEFEPGGKMRRPGAAHKWAAVYMDRDTETVIQVEYFWSFPFCWRRWMRSIPGSTLALSPCAMVGLADANMSQDVRRTLIEATERAADPPQMIAAGAVEGPLDLAPSGENYIRRSHDWRSGKPIQAIENGGMPNYALDFSRDQRAFMGQAWLINLLTLPEKQVTAYEAEKLLDQDAREASPIFEPMEADNAIEMHRAFDVSDRWGAFAEKPEILEKTDTRFEFETPVSRALRRLRSQQAMQVNAAVRDFATTEQQFGSTTAYRRVNWGKVQKDAIRGIGPADWLAPDDVAEAEITNDQQQANLQKAIGLAAQAQTLAAGPGGGGTQPLALPPPGGAQPAAAPAGAGAEAI